MATETKLQPVRDTRDKGWTDQQVIDRYPLLIAHLITETKGHFDPAGAARILNNHRMRKGTNVLYFSNRSRFTGHSLVEVGRDLLLRSFHRRGFHRRVLRVEYQEGRRKAEAAHTSHFTPTPPPAVPRSARPILPQKPAWPAPKEPRGDNGPGSLRVTKNHIRYLLESAIHLGNGGEDGNAFTWDHPASPHQLHWGNAGDLGQQLWGTFIASHLQMRARFLTNQGPPIPDLLGGENGVYRHQMAPPKWAPNLAQVIKSTETYEAACQSYPGWETSEARYFIEALRVRTLRVMVDNLEDYSSAVRGAPWFPPGQPV